MRFNLKHYQGYRKRGACSLVFDDGYKETLVNVLPILKKYNLGATFALATNPKAIVGARLPRPYPEQLNCSGLKVLAKIRNLGHEIASHTVNHKNLTQLTDEGLEYELRESKRSLQAKTIIYPGGKYNARVIHYVQKYYSGGRGVEEGLNHIPPRNFYTLKSFVLRKNTKWFWLNRQARKAHFHNKWLIESYHLVSDKEKDYRFTVTPEDFEKHLQKLIRLNLWIAPLGVVAKYILRKRPLPSSPW